MILAPGLAREVFWSAVAGVVVGIATRMQLDQTVHDLTFYLESAGHGAVIGIGISITGRLYAQSILPRLSGYSFVIEMLVWSMTISVGMTIAFILGALAIYGVEGSRFTLDAMPYAFPVMFASAVAVGFGFRVVRLIGPATFAAILFGRYARPQLEERVILFMDLEGSTPLAERVGETRLQTFLARLFSEADQFVTAYGGETASYLGDGMVVTWRAGSAVKNARAALAFAAIAERLTARAPVIAVHLGTMPKVRAGLHLGSVSVAEVGFNKRQISYFGDAMNVAARLQDAAKDHGGFLASQAYLDRAALDSSFVITPAGGLVLRGRAKPVEAAALAQVSPVKARKLSNSA